jgi:hypothetical protein
MTRNADEEAPGEAPNFRSRRTARVDLLDVQTSLSPRDLYTVEIKVQNVSAAGFMAECTVPVQIGSCVSLDIPGIGKVEAQVRWQIGLQMGGRFLDPISLARCEWTAEKARAEEGV